MRLVFHVGQEDSYDVVQIFEDQLRNNLKYILYQPNELVRVKFRYAFNVRAFGLQKSDHWDIQDRAELHESVFEEESDAWGFSDLFLHEFDVILEDNPTPSDI